MFLKVKVMYGQTLTSPPSIRNPLSIWDMMNIEKLVDLTDAAKWVGTIKARVLPFKGGMEDECHCYD